MSTFAWLLLGLGLISPPGTAGAADRGTLADRAESSLGMTCSAATSSDGVSYVKCTGEIPSFDGIGLDVDLFLPEGAAAPLPTVLMLHGWGGDKTSWEANSKAGEEPNEYHWNNVWFVSRGYAVLSPTARGFKESCGQFDPDPNCPEGYTHLAERSAEGRDWQTILGKVVDARIGQARGLVSTGNSYGGGQSWLLATSLPWKSPEGRELQLAAAVPQYPWTDLLYSLLPNGRQSDGPQQQRSHEVPLGIPKESYIDLLYAGGRAGAEGRYNTDPTEPETNLDLQYSLLQEGEPYDEKPNIDEIVTSYRGRSAYYAAEYLTAVKEGSIAEVPVFSIQGWTDPLFPPAETLQMFRKLEAARPNYPIFMAFGDVGHSNAQNPLVQWRPINDMANRFLSIHVLGSDQSPPPKASAFVTRCPAPLGDSPNHPAYQGEWDGLAQGRVRATSGTAGSTSSADSNQEDGAATDPVAHEGCLTEPAGFQNPSAALWTWAVPESGFTTLGLPLLRARYELVGQDATVATKLWDVAPDGSKTLVTRGAYRLSTAHGDPASGTLRMKLFGNAWRFEPSHLVQLQITQADSPYLRPDNLQSTIAWSLVRLTLPTRQPGFRVLSET